MKNRERCINGLAIAGARLCTAVLAMTVALAGVAQAQITNFSTDVATSIDMGIDWLIAGNAYNDPSSAGDAAGLALLALMEKRVSADPNAVTQGYSLATPAHQALMRVAVRYILKRGPATSFYAYRDGANLMALSLYLRSGGPDLGAHPDLAGAPEGLVAGINRIFDRIAVNQNAAGYWCYTNGGCNDSSTTQFVMAGLASARSVYSDPSWADPGRLATLNTLAANARQGYINSGTAGQSPVLSATERGHGYNAGNTNSLQQTSSGLWIQLVGGADVNDASVQGYLEWVRNRYGFPGNNNANGGWSGSWAYYLWSSSKAYQFMEDSGVVPNPGNLSPADIGILPPGDAPAFANRKVHLDPNTVARVALFGAGGPGYYADPAEPARVYFDYAHSILSLQSANGMYNNPAGQSHWNNFSRQSYCLLVLQRSVGGGCIDSDGDGVCDVDDNCPAIVNPNQEDADGDGVGDVCDNCPLTPNANQDPAACAVQKCDIDGDGDVDISDIRAITGMRGQTVPPADPNADVDDNGIININDARGCVLECTNPRCAP